MSPVTEGPCRTANPKARAPVSRYLPNSEGIGPKRMGLSRSLTPTDEFTISDGAVTRHKACRNVRNGTVIAGIARWWK
ncbi:hypothetical protein K474DRAFT_1658783 [Panus rudis PR-1116 ss-1]|nr:hypothetical protein K474DRAFT_1658783 [Panus rudis PR-1116 ss-1]